MHIAPAVPTYTHPVAIYSSSLPLASSWPGGHWVSLLGCDRQVVTVRQSGACAGGYMHNCSWHEARCHPLPSSNHHPQTKRSNNLPTGDACRVYAPWHGLGHVTGCVEALRPVLCVARYMVTGRAKHHVSACVLYVRRSSRALVLLGMPPATTAHLCYVLGVVAHFQRYQTEATFTQCLATSRHRLTHLKEHEPAARHVWEEQRRSEYGTREGNMCTVTERLHWLQDS